MSVKNAERSSQPIRVCQAAGSRPYGHPGLVTGGWDMPRSSAEPMTKSRLPSCWRAGFVPVVSGLTSGSDSFASALIQAAGRRA